MKLVNLTPHSVYIFDGDEIVMHLPPEEQPARCIEQSTLNYVLHSDNEVDIPVVDVAYGHIENLPPKNPGVVYVVSILVAQNASYDRDDLLTPFDLIRNVDGDILGCRKLARII